MRRLHFTYMAQQLIDGAVIKAEDKEAAIHCLMTYWDDKAAFVWTVADIMDYAEEQGKQITENQAKQILDSLLDRHDASVGVNWDVIDAHLDFVTQE